MKPKTEVGKEGNGLHQVDEVQNGS